MSHTWLTALVFGIALSACAEDDPLCPAEEEQEHEETASGATCNGSPLTYENFGRQFMENYCTSCHSSALKGEEARKCAPDDHNFDSLDEILVNRDHIDEHAAAGPTVVNEEMPPADEADQPTEQERRDLGTWLACEEEKMP